jgi:hypothetical protein
VLISILLVRALPREAMSAQRVREERLIDRGQEYARAVKLYFRENKKYPQELDDLEDTNGIRYLRRRYKDPMTGEDEWRLIHVGTDGRFKDSLVYDTEDPEEMQNADGRMGAGGSGFGSQNQMAAARNPNARGGPMDANTYQALYGTPPPAQPGVFQGAEAVRQQRESAAPDNPLAQQNVQFGIEGMQGAGDPNNPETAGLGPDGRPLPIEQQQPTDLSNLPPGQVPMEAGQRQSQQVPPGYPTQPGMPGYGLPGSRGAIASRNRQNPYAQQQQQQAGGQPAGFGMANVSPDAASVIGRLLTTPRPGGLAGIQGMQQQQGAGQQMQAFQEGIAGVASKAEQFGVKVYKGKSNYNEWEFVYDYRQDAGMTGMPGGQQAMGNLNPNQPGVSAGGALTGNPGAFQPIPGIGPQPVGVAPPQGPDPRQSQFGGGGAGPQLPSTGASDGNDQEPVQAQDGSTPGDPTQTYPSVEENDIDIANPAPPPAAPPSRTYQLPKSRTGTPNN